MTENFYRTGNYKVDRTTFGGELTLFDFEGHYTLTGIAAKIEKDFAFDRSCRKNAEFRNTTKKTGGMNDV